jgi:hypothetical protein
MGTVTVSGGALDSSTLTRLRVEPAVDKPKKFGGFSGKGAVPVDAFLFNVEQYFGALRIAEQDKVACAANLLEGNATNWWRGEVVRTCGVPMTFEEFKLGLTSAFQPVDPAIEARNKLSRLKQTGSVQSYASEVMGCLFYLPRMHEADRVHAFTAGLKSDVHREVLHQGCVTLAEAIKVAAKEDNFLQSLRSQSLAASGGKPNPRHVASKSGRSNAVEHKSGPKVQMSCFNCGEVGHKVDKCPVERDESKIQAALDKYRYKRSSGNAQRH